MLAPARTKPPTAMAQIASESLPRVVLRVGTTTSEYTLDLGGCSGGLLELRNSRSASYTATPLAPAAGCPFEFSPGSTIEVPSGGHVELALRVRPGTPAGSIEGTLTLSLTAANSRDKAQRVLVKLRARVAPQVLMVRREGRGMGGAWRGGGLFSRPAT